MSIQISVERLNSEIELEIKKGIQRELVNAKLTEEDFLNLVSGLAVGYAFHNQGKYNPNGTDFREWLKSEKSEMWKPKT